MYVSPFYVTVPINLAGALSPRKMEGAILWVLRVRSQNFIQSLVTTKILFIAPEQLLNNENSFNY
jgi:hypothetical protein